MKNLLDAVKSKADIPQGWKFYNIYSRDSRKKGKNEWTKAIFKDLMAKIFPNCYHCT